MRDPVFDVAVVGGGPVGSALALALDGAGFAVALLDRLGEAERGAPDFDGRAYAVALGSVRLLGRIGGRSGLWDGDGNLAARAEPVRDIRVGEGSGSPSLLHFDPRATEEGRVAWILEDRWLRQRLIAALAASGVERIAAGVEPGEPGQGPGLARLRRSDGGGIAARLVVAADGRRSPLAAAAGIGRIGWSYRQTGLVAAIEHERPHEGLAHQSFFPGGPFAVLPLPGNRCSIVWSEREATAAALMRLDDRAHAGEIARRIGPRLGAIRLAGRRSAHPLALGLAETYVAPRLVLVGDAAHGVHPIAGQGLNMGLRDVAALAEVLVEAARRGEDIGAADVLRRYERWRRFDATVFALGMDALNRLFSNGSGWLGLVRRTGLTAVGASETLTALLMREATGQSGEVPRLLRGEAL